MDRFSLRLAQDGVVLEERDLTEVIRLGATDGLVYSVVHAETGQPPAGLVLRRRGQDLALELDGEPLLLLEDFYAVEGQPIVSLDGSLAPALAQQLTPVSPPLEPGNGEVGDGVVWRASESEGEGEGGFGLGTLFVGLGGLGLALGASGGSGGAAALLPAPIPQAVSQSLAVSLMKGPFLKDTVDLQVVGTGGLLVEGEDYRRSEVSKVIQGQEVVLGYELEFFEYAGAVLVAIIDRDASQPDFLDEVEGPVNLDAALRAFAEVPAGGTARVSITPFTEKAVRLAEQELSGEGLGDLTATDVGTLSAILASPEKVQLLKDKVSLVSTLVGVDINTQPIAVNDPDYVASEDAAAQFYGYQLAAFSQLAAGQSPEAGDNGSGDVGSAIDRLLALFSEGADVRQAIDQSAQDFLQANQELEEAVADAISAMRDSGGGGGPVFVVSELRSEALGLDTVRFGGTAEGPVAVRFDEDGRAIFSRAGLEASAKPSKLLEKMLVGVNSTELRIDLTNLATEAGEAFTVNAPDAQNLVIEGDLRGGADSLVISVADPDAGSLGEGDAVDIRALRLDLSSLTLDPADRLVFDFAGPEDLVILEASSDLGSFTTIEVKKGTADLRALPISDGVDFVVNSGLVVSLAQFQALASVTSVTGLGALTVVVSADPGQQAQDLATLQAFLAETEQVLIGSSLALEDTAGTPVENRAVAEAFSTIRFPSLPELANRVDAFEGLAEGERFSAEDYSTLAALNDAVKALEGLATGGDYALSSELATLKTTLEGYADTAVAELQAQIEGLGEGESFSTEDYSTLAALNDAVKALEGLATGGDYALSSELATLKTTLEGYADAAVAELQAQIEGLGEGESFSTEDYSTLAALNDAVKALEGLATGGDYALSSELATLKTILEGYADAAVAELQAQIEGLGEGERFSAEDYSTLAALNTAVQALEDSTEVAGLQTQIDALVAALDDLGVEVSLKDWVEDGKAPLQLGLTDLFAGDRIVDNTLIDSFRGQTAGYDPASVPLTVTDSLTIAQAVALGEAGFALGTKVAYTINDAYVTVQAALANPSQSFALASATEVIATGSELNDPVNMTAMTQDVNLRVELGHGDDTYLGSRANEQILGQSGQDVITLTYLDDSQDQIIFSQINDGQPSAGELGTERTTEGHADRVTNFQVENDAIGLEGDLLSSTLGSDVTFTTESKLITGGVDYLLGAPAKLEPGEGEWASLRAYFNLNVHEFGLLESATQARLEDGDQVDVADLLDADAVANALTLVFDTEAGAAGSSDDGERNTTVFAITAADDPTRTSLWVHRQSSSTDVTIEADELTLLASIEARNAGFSGTNFRPAATLKDATPPTTPTLDLDPATDSGKSDGDHLTQDTTPTFTGVAEPGSTVKVLADGELLGTTIAGVNGAWRFTVPEGKALGGGEAAIEYAITATATDEAGNESAAAESDVSIDDVAPIFTFAADPSIDENSGAGQSVLNPTATDDFSISRSLSGEDADLFTFDRITREVVLSADPDHETKSSYSFTVVATDAAGNVSEQAVILSVNDLDESAPEITSGATATAVDENSGENQVIYAVTATDTADVDDSSDTSAALSYSLKDGGDKALLSIDASTGEVTLTADPDHETKSSYSFTVVATDAAGNATEQAVTLNIADLDESSPVFAALGLPQPSSLDGANGFVLEGAALGGAAGDSVSGVGDLNNDGLTDLAVGAPNANINGETYVVFGRANGFEKSLSLEASTFDGSNGFVIQGEGNRSGWSVSGAGDLNDDGIADMVIGAPYVNSLSGRSYVVFGRVDGVFEPSLALDQLGTDGGTAGFVFTAGQSFSGDSVSGGGDLDGDGLSDLVIGAPGVNSDASAYVLFGSDSDSFNKGFTILSEASQQDDEAGAAVSVEGDLNGDGLDDLVIGAPGDNKAYVVFGSTTVGDTPTLTLQALGTTDGPAGFVIDGISGKFGSSVSIPGDLNGDSVADLVIGAPTQAKTYVVFGRGLGSNFDGTLQASALDGSNGFVIEGSGDQAGVSVSAAGDVNGDGRPDLLIGAPGGMMSGSSKAYVVFGSEGGFGSSLSLSTLPSSNGFVLESFDPFDNFGKVVSGAGDLNGDGIADLVIGAPGANGGTGKAYVVFGSTGAPSVNENSGAGQVVYTAAASDTADSDDETDTSDTLTYSLRADNGDDAAAFTIDGSTGEVTLTANPDADTKASYSFTVVATDNGGNTAEQAVTLSVNDLDDSAPVITSGVAATAINENSGENRVIYTVTATDTADVDDDTDTSAALSYSLKADNDDDAAAFTINAGTGAVTLTANPDHEHQDSYSFTVVATDSAGNTAEQAVTLSVNDVDESAPVITSGATAAAVDENSGEKQVIYTVSATDTADVDDDADTSAEIIYSFKEGVDRTGLSMHPTLGEVTLTADPDHETQSSYSFTVVATDAAGNATEQAVTLDINDLDESAPTFPQSGPPKLSVQSGVDGLDGDNGFVAAPLAPEQTPAKSWAGWAVSGASDLNSDGLADMIIGAPEANGGAGAAYVIFGRKEGFSNAESLLGLFGNNGFVLNGASGDGAGASVSSAADLNGDGISDLVIGAPGDNGENGRAYVVFGRDAESSFAATLDLSSLNVSDGFVLQGAGGEQAGYSVSGAGDLNGDGIDDLLIGATDANSETGRTYVVFGSATGFGASLSLASLDDGDGFIIEGIADGDQAGYSVSGAGDLNGDGLADLVIGAPIRQGTAGAAYVVFGRDGDSSSPFPATLAPSDLNGSDGFRIEGLEELDYLGWSVSDAGDLNDDGISDLALGASGANKAYVVFGRDGSFGSNVALSDLDGTNGFVLEGAAGDQAGYSVSSAGDYNGDGIEDLLIGAPPAVGAGGTGKAYLVFGQKGDFEASLSLATLAGTRGTVLEGAASFDSGSGIGWSVGGAGDVNGDGLSDLLIGAPFFIDSAGKVAVVFGTSGPSIDENIGARQVVYTAAATDTADSDDETDTSEALTYSLKADNDDDAAAFTIDGSTGEVTLTANPDFETKASYSFTVVATDSGGNTAEQAITLSINNLPVAASMETAVAQSSASHSVTSSEVGTAYLVASSVTVNSASDITSADGTLWNEVDITTANTATDLSLEGLAEGDYKLYAVDESGTLSGAIDAVLSVDDTPPTMTTVTATDDFGPVTGQLSNGDSTDDASLVLSGTTEAGASVDVYNGETKLGAATVAGTAWTYTASLADDTTYQFNIKATDVAGNTSEAGPNLTITSDLPPTPSMAAAVLQSSASHAVKSSEVGTAYLVASSLTVDSVADITSAADDQWNEVAITTANASTDLGLGGLAEGDYKLYAAAGGKLSAAAADVFVTVDDTPPSVLASADPLRLEAEGKTDGNDSDVQIAVLDAAGTYAVAWKGQNSEGKEQVFVQRFNADGSVLGEQIEMGAANGDSTPQITALGGNGAFAVAWQGVDATFDKSIYVQKFDANGLEDGQRTKLDGRTDKSLDDSDPRIVSIGDTGEFVVVFNGYVPQEGNTNFSELAVIVQRFNSVGAVEGDPVVVGGTALDPQVAAIGDQGAFLVALAANELDTDRNTNIRDFSVFVQKFEADGTVDQNAQRVKLEIPDYPSGSEKDPQIAALDNGGFAVAFVGQNSASSADTSVVVQTFDASGATAGVPVTLDGSAQASLIDADPQIAALGGGEGFVVTWSGQNSEGSNDYSIFVQKFGTDGTASGEAFKLDAIAGIAGIAGKDEGPQVAATGNDGSFAVTWYGKDNEGDDSIFLQRFKADGSTDGVAQQFEALDRNNGRDFSPRIAAIGEAGELVVAWTGSDAIAAGGELSVFLQQRTESGTSLLATDDVGPVTGELASAAVTDDTSLVLSGTTEVGASVDVYNGATLLGAATVTETAWTYTATLVDGTSYSFNIRATDVAGNESDASPALLVTSDTTAPTLTGGATTDAADLDENSGAGQVVYTALATDATAVSYSLKADNDDDGDAFTIDAGTGEVTLTANPDFEAKASYSFTVVATDTAGNTAEQAVSLAINDVEPEIDTSAVVFDLVGGVSSAHSGRTFDADTSYEIYIRVDSDSATLNTSGPTGEGVIGTWGVWSGAANLGADDRLILVGDGAPVLFSAQTQGITRTSIPNNGTLYWFASSEAAAYYIPNSNSNKFWRSTSTRLGSAQLFDTGFRPGAGTALTQVYKTTMPLGILTSQGLFSAPG